MQHGLQRNFARAWIIALYLLLTISGWGATETWAPGGSGNGGDGTWDVGVTANWNSGAVWTNGDDALFSGTGGAVTLVDPIANSLTFTAPYLLQSGTLTMSGSDVSVGSADTIGSNIIASNGLYISGTGSLLLSGSVALNTSTLAIGATGTGVVAIAAGGQVSGAQTTVSNAGTLVIGANGSLGSPLQVNGGTLSLVDGQIDMVTLPGSTGIAAGSTLDFEIGAGSDELLPTGTFSITGTAAVNLYALAGQITSGTDAIIGANTSSHLSLGNVYNGGNFTYQLLSTSSNEQVIVTSTTALGTAYWGGGQNNIWSIAIGGTTTNWVTTGTGNTDTRLTPSATTKVIFSGTIPSNEGNTVLGGNVSIATLTISGTNAVSISGYEANPLLGNDTLIIVGSMGMGINVNAGAGALDITANVLLTGSGQAITVNNTAGATISGTVNAINGLVKLGTGTLTLSGAAPYTPPTTIIGGTLVVTGSLSRTAATDVFAGAGLEVDGLLNTSSVTTVSGSISGAGTVGSISVQSGGTLAPGLTSGGHAGIMTAAENVTLGSGATFSIRLGVSGATDNDQLDMINGGQVALDGATLQLTPGSILKNPANIGLVYVIINGGANTTGTSSGNDFSQGSTITANGDTFDILYASDAAGTGPGSDVVLQLETIPEPGSGVLIVFSIFGVVAWAAGKRRTSGMLALSWFSRFSVWDRDSQKQIAPVK